LGPIVADNGEAITFYKSIRSQATGQGANFCFDFRPRPGLPDAEVFFTNGRFVATKAGIFDQ